MPVLNLEVSRGGKWITWTIWALPSIFCSVQLEHDVIPSECVPKLNCTVFACFFWVETRRAQHPARFLWWRVIKWQRCFGGVPT